MATPTRAKELEGAEFRLEPSPYGNKEKRSSWEARIEAGTTSLRDGVAMLLEWRADHADDTVTDQDDLFIEAQLEARVAVARFDEMTNDQVRSETLTDEKVADVCQAALRDAEDNSDDPDKLEEIVAEFRNRYKPPIMPSSPFMRTETELAEILMKTRELDWYGQTLDQLREGRGVVVHKAGKRKKGVS
ncbi:MAG: methane monooxygenase [Actinobacteria bacterium]|nr:methane monooxygenase [Actinomycetota bacterium]